MTLLETRAAQVRLAERRIVDDASVACRRGQVTAILGPNGAGKSTLLACLAGLRAPDAGTVLLDGRPLAGLSPRERARRIGLLPQTAEVHWNLPVETLVALGRNPHRAGWRGPGDADRAAIAQAMAATDVAAFAGRPVLALSGGERARVLLARVLAGEPDWLLADEPLANLDPAHQLAVLDLFRDCARQARGVVLVLHDLGQALRVADHIVLMSEGRIVAQGAPAAVLTPAHLASVYGVDAFIGASPSGEPLLVPLRRVERTAHSTQSRPMAR